jgi:hypothetical protein
MLGTNVLDKRDILLGTGTLMMGGINVGQLKGDVTFTPTAEYKDFLAGIPQQIIKSEKISEGATLKASMAELNPQNMAFAIGAKNITYTTETVVDEDITFGATPVTVKKNRNIEAVVVKVGETSAVLGTDYKIVNPATGLIDRIEASTVITANSTAKISYTYRKSAKISAGGSEDIPEMPAQYVYDSPDGDQTITLDIYLGQIKNGQAIAFKEDDYTITDFEITATSDSSRPPGDQLYDFNYEYNFDE